MTLEECKKEFPVDHTYVGSYGQDGTVSFAAKTKLTKGEKMELLERDDEGSIPFLVYNPATHKFDCCYFAYWPVKGYLTEGAPNGFYPYTDSEDFGIEKVDYEFGGESIFAPDRELADNMGFEDEKSAEARREQIAYNYDIETYLKGYIITTYDELNKFIEKIFNTMEENS